MCCPKDYLCRQKFEQFIPSATLSSPSCLVPGFTICSESDTNKLKQLEKYIFHSQIEPQMEGTVRSFLLFAIRIFLH